MRMTNKIMRNNSLYNINQNKLLEDKLNNQMTNQSKITRPSDDPVVAIRALRLRTNVTTVSQYYDKNAPDADSWISLTGDALNTVGKVLTDLYKQATDAAKKSYTYADLDIVLTQMKSLTKEFYASGNVDYAGRFIFSGFRTDTPITFTEEDIQEFTKDPENLKTYVIEETLGYDDISSISYTDWKDAVDKANAEDERDVSNTTLYRFRLSYNELDMNAKNEDEIAESDLQIYINGAEAPTSVKIYENAEDAYYAVANASDADKYAAAYIPSTGELVFSEAYYSDCVKDGMSVRFKYSKSNWSEGDINPVHYFHTVECDQKSLKAAMKLEEADNKLNGSKEALADAKEALESLKEIRSALAEMTGTEKDFPDVIKAAQSVSRDLLKAAETEVKLIGIEIDENGNLVNPPANPTDEEKAVIDAYNDVLPIYTALDALTGNGGAADRNAALTAVRTAVTAATPALIKAAADKTEEYQIEVNRIRNQVIEYNPNEQDQDIYYDVGFNQTIQVNTHAKEVFTHGAQRDIDDFEIYLKQLKDVESKISDIETEMAKYAEDMPEYKEWKLKLDAANKAYTYVRNNIQTKFENQISKYQSYIDDTNVAVTNNGTRGSRLDLISSRLMNQKATFKDLQSNNEDVDMSEVAVQLKSAELTYEAALMATSKVLQTNLMNYI